MLESKNDQNNSTQNEETKESAKPSFQENIIFIRDIQMEIDIIFAQQISYDLQDDYEGLDDDEIEQKK